MTEILPPLVPALKVAKEIGEYDLKHYPLVAAQEVTASLLPVSIEHGIKLDTDEINPIKILKLSSKTGKIRVEQYAAILAMPPEKQQIVLEKLDVNHIRGIGSITEESVKLIKLVFDEINNGVQDPDVREIMYNAVEFERAHLKATQKSHEFRGGKLDISRRLKELDQYEFLLLQRETNSGDISRI